MTGFDNNYEPPLYGDDAFAMDLLGRRLIFPSAVELDWQKLARRPASDLNELAGPAQDTFAGYPTDVND